MNIRWKWNQKLALLAAGLGMLTAACSGAGADERSASEEVKCQSVSDFKTAITAAEDDLAEAKSDAEDKQGTPGESDANDSVDKAEAKLVALKHAEEACGKRDEQATTTTTTAAKCNTWAIAQAEHDNNRWFSDGIREIREAKNDRQARKAAERWLSRVKGDPELMSGAISYFLHREVDPEVLVDGQCASRKADVLLAELELALADARITPSEAPTTGTNSGVDEAGNTTSATTPGVTGDRTAVMIVLKDGTVIWIMARCGNPVTPGPGPRPPGPTDEPPKCPWNPGLPPDSPNCLEPKGNNDGVNNNPDTPDQAQKDEPSDDNEEEIDRGTTPNCDVGNGVCPGEDPRPNPNPPPTSTTTRPQPTTSTLPPVTTPPTTGTPPTTLPPPPPSD